MNAAAPTWRDRVYHFFYEEEVPYAMALVRMAMPIVMLFMTAPRWFSTREIFSADGAPSQLSVGFGYGNLMPEFSGEIAVALNTLLLFASVTSAIGWCTRPSLILTFVLYTYFCSLDSISTMTKYTVIGSHVFLLLAVSPCGAVWSVDAWLANYLRQAWPGLPAVDRPKFPVWPRRLLQFLIGFIYFGAAVTKMQTPGFFSGDQLQAWMLTHINYRHPVGEYFSLYPILLVMFAYVVIVWELIFVFVIWNRTFWRPFMLAVGIMFHFMTSLTLGLLIFPAAMYTMYVSFVEIDDIQRSAAAFRRFTRQFSWLSGAVRNAQQWVSQPLPAYWRPTARVAFVATAMLTMGLGVAAEYQMDPYGIRRPDGPHQLIPVEPEIVQQMLAPTPRLRDIDKFFALDTGTIQVGDLLVDRRTSYRQGERMIAQCHLTMPHEDMWIEMHLLDSDNRLVVRRPQIATREMYRAHFLFDFTKSVEPGDYTLVIMTAGNEVLRKPLSVLPRRASLFAN